jgi:hypothetical protein
MTSRPLLALLLCALPLAAWADAPPVDGPNVSFQDPLLDRMVGHWTVSGTLLGKPVTQTVDAVWILNHQFFQIHEVGGGYEAMPMIGYDHMSERYVAHWLDVFGGRFSETLGYGAKTGDEIAFVFEYPDAPFRTRFIWDGAHAQWHWEMTQKDATGKWTPFADMTLTKA